MTSTTGNRIKERRKQLGLSAEDVASSLNISPATMYRYEKGEIEKIPGIVLLRLAEILRTTPDYLMGLTDNFSVAFKMPENIVPLPKTYMVPLLGEIACGDPILAEQNIVGYVPVVEAFKGVDFALTCKGDSMINARIFDGDIVYIHQQPEVENGQIAAVLIDNEATLKRVRYFEGKIILYPDNPAYEPLVFSGVELEQVRIIGKAIACMSSIK